MNIRVIQQLFLTATVGILPIHHSMAQAPPESFREIANQWQDQLEQSILPYWLSKWDRQHGGFLMSDAPDGPDRANHKQLVSQSRMVWGFSLAHRKGYGRPNRNYLAAAEDGYRFLQDHFLDKENGGYFWSTDLEGRPKTRMKVLYGQAFVIYAFVELYRANGDSEVLDQAMQLFRVLQEKAHDHRHGGWFEHFEADWNPILDPGARAIIERTGYKSANAHLHLMEAYTELFAETDHFYVRSALVEALEINKRYFYPLQAGQSVFHRKPDWSLVTDPRSRGLSYGHNVEFAWLMIRAEKILGIQPSRDHFRAHIDHALDYGYDWENGGLYDRGIGNQPANAKSKIWWVEAEMLAALTDALQHRETIRDKKALKSLIGFIRRHMEDPADGVWIATCEEDGEPANRSKAHNWKANYHDVRAIRKFIEAFGE